MDGERRVCRQCWREDGSMVPADIGFRWYRDRNELTVWLCWHHYNRAIDKAARNNLYDRIPDVVKVDRR